MSIVLQVNMSPWERQVLQVLTTLQYLAKVGPKSPPPEHIVHSIQLIMRPLEQTKIAKMPHAVLGYSTSVQLSTSTETDVWCVDIYSLPLSIGSAGDRP